MPWFTYNYVYLGRFTLSPAGGIGRGLWEGSLAGPLARARAERADRISPKSPTDRDELDARVREIAADDGLARRRRCCNYVNEWRDIRPIWDTPDRSDGARPRARRRRPGIPASRARDTCARIRSVHLRRRLTIGAVRPVGRRRADSLRRHQRHAD